MMNKNHCPKCEYKFNFFGLLTLMFRGKKNCPQCGERLRRLRNGWGISLLNFSALMVAIIYSPLEEDNLFICISSLIIFFAGSAYDILNSNIISQVD